MFDRKNRRRDERSRRKKIVATFEKCKARGVDVYELFDKLYEKSFKDFKNESPSGDYLNRIRLIVNAKISVVKK